jgi:hypothetical protein
LFVQRCERRRQRDKKDERQEKRGVKDEERKEMVPNRHFC